MTIATTPQDFYVVAYKKWMGDCWMEWIAFHNTIKEAQDFAITCEEDDELRDPWIATGSEYDKRYAETCC